MTTANHTLISFIIPAYNEENNIAITLTDIIEKNPGYSCEIIVVNHNSNDDTELIAKSHDVKVINKVGGTVASVRNFGVTNTTGEILVFLDSDVSLTSEWFNHLSSVISELKESPMQITGAHCTPPKNKNWIESYWFNNYIVKDNSYLGTGHMITTRKLFVGINGFDEKLPTGEDYDFCMRAINYGGKITNNPKLVAIHRDYPTNLREFIRRETWHGTGDAISIKSIFHSKVAIASILFFILHCWILITLVYNNSPNYTVLPVMSLLAFLLYCSWSKFKHCSYKVILINAIIFYFYFIGRTLSLTEIFKTSR